jgi:hypothetical protein
MKAKMVVNSVAALLAFTASCGIASAKNCKDVTVMVVNNFTHAGNKLQIKVVDMDFWDNTEAKWREEFGIKNVVVAPDGGVGKLGIRDFEHVGGEKGVRVRVQYKYLSGSSGDWSEILNAESGTFTCSADGPNKITVYVTGV